MYATVIMVLQDGEGELERLMREGCSLRLAPLVEPGAALVQRSQPLPSVRGAANPCGTHRVQRPCCRRHVALPMPGSVHRNLLPTWPLGGCSPSPVCALWLFGAATSLAPAELLLPACGCKAATSLRNASIAVLAASRSVPISCFISCATQAGGISCGNDFFCCCALHRQSIAGHSHMHSGTPCIRAPPSVA